MAVKKSAKKKTVKKSSSKKTAKKPDNPVVAVALKVIPKSYNKKIGRWIRSHKRTIFMTSALVYALYLAYYEWKIGLRKAVRDDQDKILSTQKAIRRSAKEILNTSKKIDASSEAVQSKTIFFGDRLNMDYNRLDAADKKITNEILEDPGFRLWLKKQGYLNVRKVKK